MSEKLPKGVATVAQLAEFDTLIDARAPAEFAEDHLPGAISMPVLNDEERARVGTLYKQVSVFEAKKLGAALVAKNVARHIEQHMLDKPKSWRPLVYCWRGGQRSGAFSHILREIGWDAHRIQGGYKSWRQHVIEQLALLPPQVKFRVVTGATGSGKSRLLEALAARGGQVLHLEELAAHKGSVLGNLPGQPQPAQKGFETQLFAALSALDLTQPVFVEAESRKIGRLQVPDALLDAIRGAPGLRIDAPLPARVDFLLRDYDYAIADPAWLIERLGHLKGLQSNETLERWSLLIAARDFPALVEELLTQHYDPLYQRSQTANYDSFAAATRYATDRLDAAALDRLAAEILATSA
ncbi:tRNA 2-selenouridine(34) synthase MnmH [Sulfuritalea hydrogenivorans]|uniref:tRNA 2-selenouridine synthase n=1 Tax=Sulfuritalea hydrogenivorans sk43H TaxID=1223802 RepID=W0SH04_9PROT|nr:tRNA 2-selenouridine(34) synthase MnmH [Sulfuritalea hydrogenivorans]MDK9712940.1 tRNA 2-selenouridine(34) synthase MnmH [Sulfuritalea sp.]BAO30247.1 tRNA 2-selenouridine synthase [Sulfuritalea hydrogenivorans sk43H]